MVAQFGAEYPRYPPNPVALVEAPKTAVYCSLYFGFPEQHENLLWLAVYNLSSLNFDKCKVLQGKDVYLFPDLSKDGKAFDLWSNKAKELSILMPGTRFEVSSLLETLAPNELKEYGADIADVLIKQDWRNFKLKQPAPEPQAEPVQTPKSEKGENSGAPKQTYFFDEITETTLPAPGGSFKYFRDMALKHFGRIVSKDKEALKPKYFTAWATDMETLLNEARITKQQFLNSIL